MANKNCKKCGGSGKHRSCLTWRKFAGSYSWQDCSTSATSGDRYCRCQYVKCSKCDGCFITTATVQTLGKKDDCEELTILRDFRDTYMTENHPELVREYYEIAPSIVTSINSRKDSDYIYEAIWKESLQPSIEHIKSLRNDMALKAYTCMVKDLTRKYL